VFPGIRTGKRTRTFPMSAREVHRIKAPLPVRNRNLCILLARWGTSIPIRSAGQALISSLPAREATPARITGTEAPANTTSLEGNLCNRATHEHDFFPAPGFAAGRVCPSRR
jgi:hypothetical protein